MKIEVELTKTDDQRLTLTTGFFHGEYRDIVFDVRISAAGHHVFFNATNKSTGEVVEEQFDMAQLVKKRLIALTEEAEFDSQL